MTWRIGKTDQPVDGGQAVVAPEAGELFLYCRDGHRGGNKGSIRVNINVK
jgi:hypothetical protein